VFSQRSQKIFQLFWQKDIYTGVDLGTNDVRMVKLDLANAYHELLQDAFHNGGLQL